MVLGLGGVLEASYLFYYTPRDRVLPNLVLPILFGVILRGLLCGYSWGYLRVV